MTKTPKYVGQYFLKNVTKEEIKKRFKQLDKSRWGYKTKEYRDLKRYFRIYGR